MKRRLPAYVLAPPILGVLAVSTALSATSGDTRAPAIVAAAVIASQGAQDRENGEKAGRVPRSGDVDAPHLTAYETVNEAIREIADRLRALGHEQSDKLEDMSQDLSDSVSEYLAALEREAGKTTESAEESWEARKSDIQDHADSVSDAFSELERSAEDAWEDGRDATARQLDRLNDLIGVHDDDDVGGAPAESGSANSSGG